MPSSHVRPSTSQPGASARLSQGPRSCRIPTGGGPIPIQDDLLAGWLYPAAGAAPGAKSPAIVLAHGLGGVKEMRLDAYCERFSRAGFVCVAFDYRYWGGSTGKPRGLVAANAQIEDWNAALAYTAALPQVDAERIGIFGSSFSGGHAIRLAAANRLVKAAVSQCPFTDGLVSSTTAGISNIPKLALLSPRDMFFSTVDEPVRVSLIGKPGDVALMTTPDAYDGCLSLLPPGMKKLDIEAVPARLALYLPFMFPGSYAKQTKCPVPFAVCGKDTLEPTLRSAKQAPKGVIKTYPNVGHFGGRRSTRPTSGHSSGLNSVAGTLTTPESIIVINDQANRASTRLGSGRAFAALSSE